MVASSHLKLTATLPKLREYKGYGTLPLTRVKSLAEALALLRAGRTPAGRPKMFAEHHGPETYLRLVNPMSDSGPLRG